MFMLDSIEEMPAGPQASAIQCAGWVCLQCYLPFCHPLLGAQVAMREVGV